MKLHVEALTDFTYRPATLSPADVATFVAASVCPACGDATERRPAVAIGGRRFEEALRTVLCSACGHATYDRVPTEAWLDRFYAREWDAHGRTSAIERPAKTTAALWAAIALNVPRRARILDFGCGFGDAMRAMRDAGFVNLFGVDPGEHRARIAAIDFPGRIRQGSVAAARAIAAASGPFDAIVTHHVLEHVREPGTIIRELATLLAPDGRIVTVVPDFQGESPVLTALYLPHLHLFNRVSMGAVMRQSGLTPFQWPHSPGDLVVAGGAGAWRPSASEHFDPIPTRVDEDELKRMVEYLTSPWQDIAVGATAYLAYFQVRYGRSGFTTYPGGFHRLEHDAGLWLYVALQRSGILRRVSGRRGVGGLTWSLLRALNGPRTAELSRVLALTGAGPAELPWLTRPDGATLVLTK